MHPDSRNLKNGKNKTRGQRGEKRQRQKEIESQAQEGCQETGEKGDRCKVITLKGHETDGQAEGRSERLYDDRPSLP